MKHKPDDRPVMMSDVRAVVTLPFRKWGVTIIVAGVLTSIGAWGVRQYTASATKASSDIDTKLSGRITIIEAKLDMLIIMNGGDPKKVRVAMADSLPERKIP